MSPDDENSLLNSKDVRQRFDRAAAGFNSVDFVHSTMRDGLLARLAPMVVDARRVIDLGAATGSAAPLLAKRFRGAHVVAVDISSGMLGLAKKRGSWFARVSAVQADARSLPFPDHSVDVVFSNLLLPWIDDPAQVFAEVARVLRDNGLFLFSTLGPDSLDELREAWGGSDPDAHVRRFPDMHDIGDAAVRAGLCDPVLDVDRLLVTYRTTEALFADLSAVGARNSLQRRNRTLGGARRFREMARALDRSRQDGLLSIDLELVYGHCWGPGARSSAGEYRIDATQIQRR
jgi:malonyl-CoA O-methyltransferase